MASVASRMSGHREDWRQAEQRYAERRDEAGRQAAAALAYESGIYVRFRPISSQDIELADQWNVGDYGIGWSWEKEVMRARRRTRRLEAAIESDPTNGEPTVCGLFLGRLSRSNAVGSLHFLGRADAPNPLEGRLTQVAVRYLEFCAAAFGCKTTSIRRPIPELVEVYKAHGFVREIKKKGRIERLEQDLHFNLSAA